MEKEYHIGCCLTYTDRELSGALASGAAPAIPRVGRLPGKPGGAAPLAAQRLERSPAHPRVPGPARSRGLQESANQ